MEGLRKLEKFSWIVSLNRTMQTIENEWVKIYIWTRGSGLHCVQVPSGVQDESGDTTILYAISSIDAATSMYAKARAEYREPISR